MTGDEDGLRDATAAYKQAAAALDDARTRLRDAIVQAARAGRRQREIVQTTGYTREQVRRICRAAGIKGQ